MLFIGIDIASDKHDCCVLSSEGKVLCDGFTFLNSRDGFEEFVNLIERYRLFPCGNEIKIGLESTGHYSANLLAFLRLKGFNITVFNALSVNRFRTAGTLRRTKTDKSDAQYIARLLAAGGTNSPCRQHNPLEHLKSLSRARYRLVKEIQPLKNRYRRLIRLLFPEFIGFFCDIYSTTALCLFDALPSAHDIAGCNILKLTSVLSTASRGHFKRSKADVLKLLAQKSIAAYDPGAAFELRQIANRIRFIEDQQADLETEIHSFMLTLNSPITSITGIGYILGATIISEIGDIHAFSNPNKLLAFAGCEPSTYQSGKFTATNTPMVKRGSRYLRNALYLATGKAYMHSPSFRSYINRKAAQGKHFYTAMSHGMKKMCRVIFAVLTSNTPYSEPAI